MEAKPFRFHRLVTVALVAALGFSSGLQAMTKQELLTQLAAAADDVRTAKANNDAVAKANAIASYQAISDMLGGDDPFGFGNGKSGTSSALPLVIPGAPPGFMATTTTFTETPGTPIPDGPGGMLADTTSVVTADTFLFDIELDLDVTHSFSSDLSITLTSPLGTTVVITTNNGGVNDDVFSGTVFDDDAVDTDSGNVATDFAYVDSTAATPLVPEGAMAAFIGEDPNGTWTLDITDGFAVDTGALNEWSLIITTLDGAPSTSQTSSGLSPGIGIPDAGVGTLLSNIVITGAGDYLCDLDMDLNITHTWSSDLDIFLTSPAGTQVTVTTDNGLDGLLGLIDVYAGTSFNDSETTNGPVTDFVFTDGVAAPPMVPEGAFGAFIGEDPNGTWRLDITDDSPLDTGALISWGLNINTCDEPLAGGPLPPVPTMSRTAMIMLALVLLLMGGLVVRRVKA